MEKQLRDTEGLEKTPSEIQILTQSVQAILAKLNQDDDAHINAAKMVIAQLNRIEEKLNRLLVERA